MCCSLLISLCVVSVFVGCLSSLCVCVVRCWSLFVHVVFRCSVVVVFGRRLSPFVCWLFVVVGCCQLLLLVVIVVTHVSVLFVNRRWVFLLLHVVSACCVIRW